MPDPTPSSWWAPDRHADRRPFLLARNAVARAVRGWFDARDFVEVEPSALVVSPGAETHLHAFATEAIAAGGERQALYLHTSPEFAAKKLIAAGERRLFTLARVWRNRERGPLHHPEFTMLEWYRAEAPYEQLMDDCAALLALAAEAVGATAFQRGGVTVDPFAEPERLTLAEAFARFANVDLLATVEDDGATDLAALAAAAKVAGVRVADDDSWSDVFTRVLVEKVEPRIGQGRATILCEYPAPEAALARRKPGEPKVAERFELYACDVELANCFGELTDAAEQRRRFEADMTERQRIYGERYPIDEELLAALALMPPTSGGALGFERLVMLAAGAERIEQVVWTPVPQLS